MLDKAARLKARWADDQVTYGAWLAIGGLGLTEAMGHAGFDWVCIDMEHTAIDLGMLQSMLVALQASPTVPLVRVSSQDPAIIKQVLDLGAQGILVPDVRSEAEARAVLAASKYPPVGRRGHGPFRASGYMTRRAEYLREANDALIVIIQIEDVAAMEELDRIVAVPGLDAICPGPNDFSGTVGRFGQIDHPDVTVHMKRLCRVARAANLPLLYGPIVTGETYDDVIARGYRILSVTSDIVQLCQESANKLQALRSRPSGVGSTTTPLDRG